jgi:hypothetical protein
MKINRTPAGPLKYFLEFSKILTRPDGALSPCTFNKISEYSTWPEKRSEGIEVCAELSLTGLGYIFREATQPENLLNAETLRLVFGSAHGTTSFNTDSYAVGGIFYPIVAWFQKNCSKSQ